MNFNEKLTNLRKQKGLSQEELGYELNVTRQTISKWELGQTTPEMDKLVQMSKIFGVSLDELTSESEIINNETQKIEDGPINEKPKNNSTLKVILLIVAIFIIGGAIIAIIYGTIFSKIFNFGKDTLDKTSETVKEGAETFIDLYNQEKEQIEEKHNEMSEKIESMVKNAEEDMQEEKYNEMKESILDMVDKTEKQSENDKSINQKVEQNKEEINERIESSKEQMTSEQKEKIEQTQKEQEQMLEQYQQQEQIVKEQMENVKEQMSPEQKEWFEKAQKQQQEMLQQYQQ